MAEIINPNNTVMAVAYFNICPALSCFFAPIFWADSADTADSIEDGTRKSIPISFSTIPTAAASFNPLWFANIVIIINAICINPSCAANRYANF